KYVPYHKLFERYDNLTIPGFGDFEGYPNRDSLKYISLYGLDNLDTMVRGTLRKKGFCDAWNVFVQLGLTDDSYQMEGVDQMSWLDFMKSFIPHDPRVTPLEKLASYLHLENKPDVLEKIEWLGIFNEEPIGLKSGTPAQILQKRLEEKWLLHAEDKDMCVMMHLLDYNLHGKKYLCQSSMAVIGENSIHTAMAKTVGLPLAIATKLVLEDKIHQRGVVLPLTPEIYQPILNELLLRHGIQFTEIEKTYTI
ncbi:MAG: saccharopine dehydrogenase C-terminal domain-containing protein, partial [Chitinophagales bacterium]